MGCPHCGGSARNLVYPAHEDGPGYYKCSAPIMRTSLVAGPDSYPCEHVYRVPEQDLTDAERQQEQLFRDRMERRRIERTAWDERVPDLLASIDEPVEQLMAVVNSWGRDGFALGLLFPGTRLANLDREPPWDHDAVQRWFLTAVIRPPAPQPVVQLKRGLFRGERRAKSEALGWVFPGGCTSSSDDGQPQTITVLRDGRRTIGSGAIAAEHDGFNFRALKDMAYMARVPKLPRAPLSWREEDENATARSAAPQTHDVLNDILEQRGLRVHKFER
jgi:hypothetical protein